LPKVHIIQNEVVFLGVAPSAPDGFPLAVGLGFPETRTMETVFIKPPDEWGLLDDIVDIQGDVAKDVKRKNKIIEGIQAIDLIDKGLTLDKAAEFIFDKLEGKSLFSVFPKEDRALLGYLGAPFPNQIKIQSAISLFDSFVSPEQERKLQLHTKMDLRYYPRNKSDTKWLIELLHRCQKQGSF
jgi:hypothetical protein